MEVYQGCGGGFHLDFKNGHYLIVFKYFHLCYECPRKLILMTIFILFSTNK